MRRAECSDSRKMFTDLTLHTERLELRCLRGGDEAALFAIFSDPAVMRFWSSAAWTDEAPARAMIESDLRYAASGSALRLGLVRRSDSADDADHALVGTVSLFAFDTQNQRAEIGYALRRSAQGAGLMHEALLAVINHAFTSLQLHRLEADIDPRNSASARSLQRLGFVQEGLLRERWIVNGEVSDSAMFGLLKAEWQDEGKI
jgi:[ribosomal protein S5]-alanine N-acetyltransferase